MTLGRRKDYITQKRGKELDSEIIFRQFEELEQKIDILVNACKIYKAKNQELNNKIERLEEELQGKVEAENSYQHERELIRSKIDNLLGKLTDTAEE